jgi:hypothetical protein
MHECQAQRRMLAVSPALYKMIHSLLQCVSENAL